jgi:FtsH-binding integral membrane protein
MNLRRPLRTNRRLWLACTAVAFVLLGFVHFYPESLEYKSGPTHLWGMVGRRELLVGLPLLVLAGYTALLTAAAAAFGWVAQAVIVVSRDGRRQTAEKLEQRSN